MAAIAVKVGVHPDGRAVRDVIKAARESLARHAERYVEMHVMGAQIAAEQGDTKPAQWALEMISEGDMRVVDSPKTNVSVQPSLRIGIAVGGVQMNKPVESVALMVSELRTLDGEEIDTP